jgi:thiamine biosynthesis lipoprotein
MKKTSFFIISVLLILTNACNQPKYHISEGFAQGTTYRMVYQGPVEYNDTIMQMLIHFDKTLSVYMDSSLISRINRNESTVVLNDLFLEFYNKSREVYEKSEGYFDITVAPLVAAWGFGPKEKINSDSASIDSIRSFVGMDKIKIQDNRLIKSDERMKLDGNAIAQGQSVDYIARFFESVEIQNYMVEIGGEVRAKGLNDKGAVWRIGIDKPIEGTDEHNRELQTIIKLENKSLATSGNYRKFHMVDGIKYSHSINPKTGYPAKDILLSATIITDETSIADGFATACMVMGFEKARELIMKNKELEAYFIYSGENGELKVFMSPGFEKYIEE